MRNLVHTRQSTYNPRMHHRRTIPLILLVAVAVGGCDRPPQKPQTHNGPVTADQSPVTAGAPPAADGAPRCDTPTPTGHTVKRAREVMGTFAEVTAIAPDKATAASAVEIAYQRIDDVNRLMSDYVDDSEIGRLNRLGAGEALVVSPETFRCLQRAAEIAEASGGAFDATCRPLVRLWRRAGKVQQLPSAEDIRATLRKVGWQKVRLDPATRRVTLATEGMQLDVGGIAKGYALDLAAEAMLSAGATGVLVNIGGDLRALGGQPGDTPWRIGVKHPFQTGLFGKLALKDGAVATSGVQQRFVEIDGQRYSHVIDPRTGQPAAEAPSVTVIAPDGITADAWATAFSVLPVAEARELAQRLDGIEVMWISGTAAAPIVTQTSGFAAYVIE